MSKRDELAVARALLAKAAGDEAGLRALADRDDVPDHVAGFLAQQVTEKSLKAVLIARGTHFERSHDIDYLCGLVEDDGLDLTDDLRAAVALTPWAVELRYADPVEPDPIDRTSALATVAAVRAWADRTINEQRSEPSKSSSEARATSDEQ